MTNEEDASFYETVSKDWKKSASIVNELAEFIPGVLRLTMVVAESEDLCLSCPHETLLQNRVPSVIEKSLAKECLRMFAEVAE